MNTQKKNEIIESFKKDFKNAPSKTIPVLEEEMFEWICGWWLKKIDLISEDIKQEIVSEVKENLESNQENMGTDRCNCDAVYRMIVKDLLSKLTPSDKE